MERAEEKSCRRTLEVHILTPLSPSDENDVFFRKFTPHHCVALIIVCHSFRFIFTLGVLLLWNLKENTAIIVFREFFHLKDKVLLAHKRERYSALSRVAFLHVATVKFKCRTTMRSLMSVMNSRPMMMSKMTWLLEVILILILILGR